MTPHLTSWFNQTSRFGPSRIAKFVWINFGCWAVSSAASPIGRSASASEAGGRSLTVFGAIFPLPCLVHWCLELLLHFPVLEEGLFKARLIPVTTQTRRITESLKFIFRHCQRNIGSIKFYDPSGDQLSSMIPAGGQLSFLISGQDQLSIVIPRSSQLKFMIPEA